MPSKQYYIYIMTNQRNTVLYTAITNNLQKRIWQHKNKIVKGFTKQYNINKLVHYEIYNDPETAIGREKQIKAGSRKKKIDLIMKKNSKFRDLSEDWTDSS